MGLGRIAVSKDIAKYFAEESNRRQVDEYLDWINPPQGRLTPEQRREWIVGSAEASCTFMGYVNLIERIWMEVWLEPLNRFVFSKLRTTTEFAYLNPSYPYTCPRDLFEDVFWSKTYERSIALPQRYGRKSQQTSMRASVMTSVDGNLVLGMEICNPTKHRLLKPQGWAWSETSHYQFPTPIKLTKPTRALDLSTLKVAAEDAVKAVAEFHLPHGAKQTAA